jgi:hypothetical protein
LKNDYLRWLFLKWRIDVENDVTNFWKMNNSNFSSQIDFVNCFLSFIQKRSARRVCVCVLCSKKNANKKRRLRKRSFFCRVWNFCLLRSILELIARSLVNIKREKRNLFRWRDSNIFYFILFFRHFFIQSYFNLNCYFSFWNSLKFTSCFVKMIAFNFFFLSRIMFMNRRWSSKHVKEWSKSRSI